MISDHDNLTPGDDPVESPEGDDALARRVMDRVVRDLEMGRRYDAVRLFLDAVAHEAMPRYVSLYDWTREAIGEEATRKLLTAMAHFPCFGCRGGYERCSPCAGSGFASVRQVCNACAGFGTTRCDFCNASGLATYNLVPAEFRRGVLLERAATAIRHVRKLCPADPAATAAHRDAEGRTEQVRQRVMDLNKLLGVLENAVLAARQLVRAGLQPAEAVADVASACVQAALRCDADLRQALAQLADEHERIASQGTGADAELAADRAEYYAGLSRAERLAGTMLDHPFLAVASRRTATGAPPEQSEEERAAG